MKPWPERKLPVVMRARDSCDVPVVFMQHQPFVCAVLRHRLRVTAQEQRGNL